MALYLGSSEKQKIILDGVLYCLNLSYKTSNTDKSISWKVISENEAPSDIIFEG